MGARWSRVDWEKKPYCSTPKSLSIRKRQGYRRTRGGNENKSSRRTLPLPDPVYEMLCEEREKQDLYRRMFKGSYNRKYDDYICVDQLGGLIRPNRVTQRFADLIRQYGLRKIRFHDLRHTFASILINQDAPLLNVSTFLGHSDLSTTANIYAHLDKSKKQESADVISSIFNKARE
ncbi:MAG: site-specific integrase [Oscillospiraceae bacterium]